MNCPDWENCDKKGCIEMERCIDAGYWESLSRHISERNTKRRSKVNIPPVVHPPGWKSKSQMRREKNNLSRAIYFKDRLPCVKNGVICDKQEACSILSQCVVTLKIVTDNSTLLNQLRGPHSLKQVLSLFRDHCITPMKSYYYHTKY